MSIVTRKKHFVLGRRHNGMRMTLQEFDTVKDFDELYSYELINGVVIVTPIPGHFERDPNEELGHWLRSYQDRCPGIVDATLFEEYIRTGSSRRRADRAIWIGLGRTPNPERDVPAIVVEFVSQRRRDWLRDYVEKKGEYLALGVREYWIINRFERTLTIFRRGKAGIDEEVVHERQTYNPTLLPGFELPLGKLLAIADRWKRIR